MDVSDGTEGLQTSKEQREHQRHACDWPALCTTRSVRQLAARVVDASEGGFRVSAGCNVEVGDTVLLELDQIGTFECEVRWCADSCFGVSIVTARNQLNGQQVEALAEHIALADRTV